MAYDESFIESARESLESKRQAILQRNRDKITELVQDYAERQGDSIDISTAEQNDSTDLLLQDRLKDILHDIEESLVKIDDGSYGECEGCGGEIAEGRLRIHPSAKFCVDCKQKMEVDASRRYKRPGLLDEFGPE